MDGGSYFRKRNILVYNGPGVDQICLFMTIKALRDSLGVRFHVTDISALEIALGTWTEKTSLLVIPGGRDVLYQEQLAGECCEQIRRYVRRGGKLLGICAGAYFCSDTVEFELGCEEEVTGTRELGFFPGVAQGQALSPGEYSRNSVECSKIVGISWGHPSLVAEPYYVYYRGGCMFRDAHLYPSVETLAYYIDAPENPAAIVACSVAPYSCANVVLSGVHPEFSGNGLRELLTGERRKIQSGPMHQRFSPLLVQLDYYEEPRLRLWSRILQKLGLITMAD